MRYPFYTGSRAQKPEVPVTLPSPRRELLTKPDRYLADPGLVDACNVALLLGQPLLVTGEPGVGKTQLAYSVAWELGLDTPLKFETKSTSESRELFYIYDALRRFQDAQSSSSSAHQELKITRDNSALPYLTYQALGAAILRTREPSEVAQFLPSDFEHPGKSRSVILIDEIDKAPRDFPNDVLNELEQMYFRVPELGGVSIKADENLNPIVVITSNSEKNLPDAFLRRCVYYHVPFPDRTRLSDVVENRLGAFTLGTDNLLDDALDLFYRLRAPESGLRKKPATAELLGWVLVLKDLSRDGENPLRRPELTMQTFSSLVKTAEDQEKAKDIVQRWIDERTA